MDKYFYRGNLDICGSIDKKAFDSTIERNNRQGGAVRALNMELSKIGDKKDCYWSIDINVAIDYVPTDVIKVLKYLDEYVFSACTALPDKTLSVRASETKDGTPYLDKFYEEFLHIEWFHGTTQRGLIMYFNGAYRVFKEE